MKKMKHNVPCMAIYIYSKFGHLKTSETCIFEGDVSSYPLSSPIVCQLKKINKSFSFVEEIKILKCLNEPGLTRKKVREKYDLGESTLWRFIKNTRKLCEYPELEDAVTL